MARVTIKAKNGATLRLPAKAAAKCIEEGGARLDRNDERGVAAMEVFIALRRTPLREPEEEKRKAPPKKTAASKKVGAPKKASTKKTGR